MVEVVLHVAHPVVELGLLVLELRLETGDQLMVFLQLFLQLYDCQ